MERISKEESGLDIHTVITNIELRLQSIERGMNRIMDKLGRVERKATNLKLEELTMEELKDLGITNTKHTVNLKEENNQAGKEYITDYTEEVPLGMGSIKVRSLYYQVINDQPVFRTPNEVDKAKKVDDSWYNKGEYCIIGFINDQPVKYEGSGVECPHIIDKILATRLDRYKHISPKLDGRRIRTLTEFYNKIENE